MNYNPLAVNTGLMLAMLAELILLLLFYVLRILKPWADIYFKVIRVLLVLSVILFFVNIAIGVPLESHPLPTVKD